MKKVLVLGIAGLLFSAGAACGGNGDLIVDGYLMGPSGGPVRASAGLSTSNTGTGNAGAPAYDARLTYSDSTGIYFGNEYNANLNTSIQFRTNNAGTVAPRVTIDSPGNVGIGTIPTGAYKLEVAGPISVAGPINDITGLHTSYITTGNAGAPAFDPSLTYNDTTGIYFGNEYNGNLNTSIQFRTNYAGAVAPRVTILASGNFGIGSASPSAKLQVAGGDVAVSSQGNGVILKATDGANCFRITVNNAGSLTTTPVTCP